MHHHPYNQERAINLSILSMSGIFPLRSRQRLPLTVKHSGLPVRAMVYHPMGLARTLSRPLLVRSANRFARVAAVSRHTDSPQDRPFHEQIISRARAFPVPAGVAPVKQSLGLLHARIRGTSSHGLDCVLAGRQCRRSNFSRPRR